MAKIDLSNISHTYNPDDFNPTYALNPFSMTWENGNRYAILGPSGCGKTTMLNIVSGLVRPSGGKILFDNRDVTNLKTESRNIAQVFQFPVIYNTMTVYDNLAFPLKCREFAKEKIEERVQSVSQTLNLSSFLNMPARKLTADQKQLISLGRGLVREDVAAVLMDEPLTVIDSNYSIKFSNLEINTKTDLSKIKNKKVKLGIRSEFIKIANDQKENVIDVKVSRVEDFGNFKLITGKIGEFEIKSKVERETPISLENLKLFLPAEKCCVYSEERLVQ